MKLNEKIAYYRREKKLSQEELAAQVGVSRQAVSKWELGEASPDVGKLLALARAFGVTTDHLLDDEEGPERSAPPPVRDTAAPPPTPGQDRFSDLPGFLGRMVRRWGWLAGIYIALVGLGPTLFGIIGMIMVSSASQAMNSMGGWDLAPFPGETIYMDADGNFVSFQGSSGISGAVSGMAAIPAIFLVIGIVMIVGGLILAYVLWKKGNEGD